MAKPLAGMWRIGEAGAMAASCSPLAAGEAAAGEAAVCAAAAGRVAGRTKLRRALRGWVRARRLAEAEEGRLPVCRAASIAMSRMASATAVFSI